MSGFDPTTTAFLAKVKLFAFEPDADGSVDDSDILLHGTDVLITKLVPEVEKLRENYYITSKDVAPVASQAEYDIPEHAAGGVLRNIWWIRSSGRGQPLVWRPITDIDSFGSGTLARGTDPYFAIEGDKVVLLPAPTSAVGTIRFRFFNRPGRLVATTEAALITAIDRGTGVITCAEPGWATTDQVDFIAGDRGHETLGRDVALTTVTAGTSITVTDTGDIPADLRPNTSDARARDYVALAGESPIVQLPIELHSVHARLTAVEVLLETGDPRWRDQQIKAEADLRAVMGQLSPRTQGGRKAVNRSHPLSRSGRRWGR